MINTMIKDLENIMTYTVKGNLNKNTIYKLQNEVTDMIRDNGIRNVVFNVSDLTTIDVKGINGLLYNYELCKTNNGQSLLCGLNNSLVRHRIENSRLLKYMNETSDELSAFNIINL